jgi:predicted DNA binding CopG/RHH family protein
MEEGRKLLQLVRSCGPKTNFGGEKMECKDRDKMIKVRVTNEEMDILKKKAKSCNLTMSKYVRFMIKKDKINSLKGFDNHLVEEKIGNLDKQLTKIGINVRQIVYNFNKGGNADNKTIEGIEKLLNSIEKRVELIEKAITNMYE